ncbi:MAG: hypothetical protein IJQ11_08820 [Bacteroidales bacterium]|nr:hypothetical protein [Bacteroidales bacterium]
MKTKLLILMALVVALTSCVKTKNYRVNDANRDWFADSTNCNFTMEDDNGIQHSFRFAPANSYTTETGATILFIPTEKGEYEHIEQIGANSYGTIRVAPTISAYKWVEYSDINEFRLYFNEAIYVMGIDGNLFYPDSDKRYKCYESGYENAMDYTAEYLDSYTVNEKVYEGVMHLKLNDVAYPQTQNFPTEIYYAKHYGLIQVALDDKLTLRRLP